MSKILISINPEHVDSIISGIKKYEFRTKVAKRDIDSIIVYCTSPMSKVLAEVQILDVLCDTPENLWNLTSEYAGIEKSYFDKYFFKRTLAYAYVLGEVTVFEHPRELKYYGFHHAPQSFVYL